MKIVLASAAALFLTTAAPAEELTAEQKAAQVAALTKITEGVKQIGNLAKQCNVYLDAAKPHTDELVHLTEMAALNTNVQQGRPDPQLAQWFKDEFFLYELSVNRLLSTCPFISDDVRLSIHNFRIKIREWIILVDG